MRRAGSAPSPPRPSADAMWVLAVLALALVGYPAAAQQVTPQINGDSIPRSLTGQPGDATRGRVIVANRSVGLCLLCHSGQRGHRPLGCPVWLSHLLQRPQPPGRQRALLQPLCAAAQWRCRHHLLWGLEWCGHGARGLRMGL